MRDFFYPSPPTPALRKEPARFASIELRFKDYLDIRVSTGDQDTDRESGKDADRAEPAAMLDWVREGDTVVVYSMDHLARSLVDLRHLVDDLTGRGVRVEFGKESPTFTDEDSPVAHLMLNIRGAVAEFERALIR